MIIFWWEVKPLIDQLLPNLQNNVKSNLKSFHNSAINYLEKVYDFSDDNIFKKLEALHFKDVTFSCFEKMINSLKFNKVCPAFNLNEFYKGLCSHKNELCNAGAT